MGIFNENAGRMAISAITLSELFHGAEKSAKVAQNLAVVEEFASLLEVLPYSAKASQHYGAIRTALEKAGVPCELHVFEKGGHGFGLGSGRSAVDKWPGLCIDWMRTEGILKAEQLL